MLTKGRGLWEWGWGAALAFHSSVQAVQVYVTASPALQRHLSHYPPAPRFLSFALWFSSTSIFHTHDPFLSADHILLLTLLSEVLSISFLFLFFPPSSASTLFFSHRVLTTAFLILSHPHSNLPRSLSLPRVKCIMIYYEWDIMLQKQITYKLKW